ncbi:hypothetical protein BCR34DRAFT_594358 [Clohesyomyces aquaticus]|uniref:Aminoacyl-tRNA synthetase class I anticodon-binding domain-containing protein n=1 Tax=Clohesyomyces aquaticus TaxID=1231657 RepID=A0A1Y1YAD8_9PLEO|nr:hypothetical protein BCR34DRAFT_594358 [Clohesyomyces aquaticus]
MRLVEQPDSPYKELPDFLSVKNRDVKVHDYLRSIILSDAENYTNANEFLYRNSFMLKPLRHNPSAFTDEGNLVKQMRGLEEVNEQNWTKKIIADKIWEVIRAQGDEKHQSKKVFHYLRKALTGKEEGMRMYDIMEILGREECLNRLGAGQRKGVLGSLF